MKIGTIIRNKQPDVLEKMHKMFRRDERNSLSFSYTKELMEHDSYTRHNGALKQIKWGK